MRDHATLLSLMANTPLLAHPRKAAIVFNVLRQRIGRAGIALPDIDAAAIDALSRPAGNASQFSGTNPQAQGDTWLRREPYRLDGGVGIVTVTGSMVNRGAWVGDDGSGLTSYEGIKFQLSRLKQDSRAHSAILDIETPGGQAIGAFELAAAVRDVASVKPVYAIVNGMAASAGYALASGATRIITTPSGLSGSIGVVMLHLDQSGQLEQQGIVPTFIYAGDHKVEGNGYEALSETDKQSLQEEVDKTYKLFLATVAKGRGDRLTVAKARDTQARTFMGKEAVDVGLADSVATFEDVLSEAQARARKAFGKSSTSGSKATMSALGNDDQNNPTQQAGTVTMTQADLDAKIKAAVDAAVSGQADAASAATKAAAERLAKITGHEKIAAHAGRVTAAAALAAKNPDMSADDVVSFVADHVPETQAAAPGRKTIEQRQNEGGSVSAIHGGPIGDNPGRPGGEQTGDEKATQDAWKSARAKAAQQFEAGLSIAERAKFRAGRA